MIKVDFYSAGCEIDMRTDLRLLKLLLSFSFAFFCCCVCDGDVQHRETLFSRLKEHCHMF